MDILEISVVIVLSGLLLERLLPAVFKLFIKKHELKKKHVYSLTKFKFERGFEMCKHLQTCAFDLHQASRSLCPIMERMPRDEEAKKEWEKNERVRRWSDFTNAYNTALKEFSIHEPFLNSEINSALDNIRDLCRQEGINYDMYNNFGMEKDMDYYMERGKFPKDIEPELKGLVEAVSRFWNDIDK